MDIISIPINRVNKVLNVAAMETPHKTKKIKAKYSDTLAPTFSKSLPLSKKYNKVQDSAIVIKVKLKLLKCSMSFKSMLKKDSSVFNSMQLANKIKARPTIAQYLGVVFDLKNTPPNIITIPQIAVNIIAFIMY